METMESLNGINQKTPFPSVPPCISIQINRYNEISLNIFNNNPIVRPPEEPQSIK